MFAHLRRCFGRVDVDGEESRVKQTKPKKACRKTSSHETVLNKVQSNEEEERLNRELELTTKERNHLTDPLLYVTGGSMNKSPHFRPNPFYEKLKIKEKEVMSLPHNLYTNNTEHREKFPELKKENHFYQSQKLQE
ncbi:disks large homolog 5-like [Rattus norvegicus]|uniref:disks large homolog 5-like n=1 Tax=Rattus norvegicus TaxID=10116 RepID=UPI002FD7DB55